MNISAIQSADRPLIMADGVPVALKELVSGGDPADHGRAGRLNGLKSRSTFLPLGRTLKVPQQRLGFSKELR